MSTTAVHAGSTHGSVGDPVSGEIFQTTTFVGDPAGAGEVLYSRFGNNPGHRRLEAKIAALEGAEECLVTGSGMGAISAALLGCLHAGDHVLAAEAVYGGTRLFLDRELSRLGIDASYADFSEDGWQSRIRPTTRVLLAELPANPDMRVPDPAELASAAAENGAVLILDVTFATPINFCGLDHGADLVVHSATKYLGGHSDVTAGAVCGGHDLVSAARDRAQLFGTALDPHAAWLVERGVKTLALRMDRHNSNGIVVAHWLSSRAEVARVHYPGLASHPDHSVAKRVLSGFGGMVGLEVRGGAEAATRFVRALKLATIAPSLGGVETLVSEPRFTSHVRLTSAQRADLGIPDGFVRLSLGIEDPGDLIADLEQALERAAYPDGQSVGAAAAATPTYRAEGERVASNDGSMGMQR
jgi:cystathionine beta-lyase/cystathionine gamma-synthase